MRFLTELRPGETHVTVSIPHWLTQAEMRRMFAGLDRTLFPERREKRQNQGRRASPEHYRDNLFALVAYRLQTQGNRLSLSEIQSKIKDGSSSRYNSEVVVSKALQRAKKEILERQKVFTDVLTWVQPRIISLVLCPDELAEQDRKS
jgi:hypothetical protein